MALWDDRSQVVHHRHHSLSGLSMTQASTRLIGNIFLGIGILIIIINVAGMSGLTPKLTSSRELNLVSLVLVIAGGSLRRRGREPRA